jgi:hypothetical protein
VRTASPTNDSPMSLEKDLGPITRTVCYTKQDANLDLEMYWPWNLLQVQRLSLLVFFVLPLLLILVRPE